jgi:hypothetical protein
MRLERSVFSIRPLSFAFQAGSSPVPPGENPAFRQQFSSEMGLQSLKRQLQSGGYSVFDSALNRMQNAEGQFRQKIDPLHVLAMLTFESKTL